MPKSKRTVETIVGIFVLTSLALLLVMVMFIGRRQSIFEKRYDIIAIYDSVAGLQPGAEVHLAGIDVGYIKEIKFSETNKVEVVMTISRAQEHRIRADSLACIRTMGLMGDRYVQITVGSEDEPMIPPGGTIRTSEVMEWEQLLETARPALGNIENTIGNISTLTDKLADPGSEVGLVLDNLKTLTTDAREGRGTIGALFARDDIYWKTSKVLDTTQETMENLKEISGNTKEASTRLPNIMKEAESGIGRFAEFSALATDAASGVYGIIDSGQEAMKNIEATTSNLKSASRDIKEATPRIGTFFDSVDESIGETRQIMDAAKKNWLLRGYFEPVVPGKPIVLSGRDIAQPEVAQ